MALADIRHEVVHALANIHDAQHDAHAALDHGEDAEKVAAAGELDFLERRDARLRRRLVEIDRRAAEHRTAFAWFRQEWFNLMLQLENWIAHR
jgi:predicted GNAT superfamily acetyltransferase